MELPADRPLLRIGELRRRLVVSDHGLQAWESRYALLQSARSPRVFGQRSRAGRRHSMASFTGGGVVTGDRAELTASGLPSQAAIVVEVTME